MNFPLELRFKLLAVAAQIAVTDAQGGAVFYVRQKAFKLREAVSVFSDSNQARTLYTIAADRILDVSARYRIVDEAGAEAGVLQRHGMRSLWRAHYDIQQGGRQVFVIREENPWIKVLDGVLGSIPIVSMLTGYLFHPAYLVSRDEGEPALLRVVKLPALLEGRYRIDALRPSDGEPLDLAVVGILMMLLLERARG